MYNFTYLFSLSVQFENSFLNQQFLDLFLCINLSTTNVKRISVVDKLFRPSANRANFSNLVGCAGLFYRFSPQKKVKKKKDTGLDL